MTIKKHNQAEVLVRGWRVLAETLGPVEATKFIRLLSRGSGDSVQYYKKMWGQKSVGEIDKIVRQLRNHP